MTTICTYCGEQHETDIICQKMFLAHAQPFTRLSQENPTVQPSPSATRLLPCPFCGEQPISLWQGESTESETFGYWTVECRSKKCGNVGDIFCGVHGNDQAHAEGRWNSRSTLSAEVAPCDVCGAEPGRCMTATICKQEREQRSATSAEGACERAAWRWRYLRVASADWGPWKYGDSLPTPGDEVAWEWEPLFRAQPSATDTVIKDLAKSAGWVGVADPLRYLQRYIARTEYLAGRRPKDEPTSTGVKDG